MKKLLNGPQKISSQTRCSSLSQWGRSVGGEIAFWLFSLTAVVTFVGCASAPVKPSNYVQTTLQVSSTPEDALVMMSCAATFDEKSALVIGRTPLLRLRNLPKKGCELSISKPGYHEWRGRITPDASTISAELVAFSEDEKAKLGFVDSQPADCLSLVPVRVGIHQLGDKAEIMESSPDAEDFRTNVIEGFKKELPKHFGAKAEVRQEAELQNTNTWIELEDNLKTLRLEKIGFYPVPRRLDLTPKVASKLKDIGGIVLLVRTEAYYLKSNDRFMRAAAPLLLSFASGATALSTQPGPIYTFLVFGGLPQSEVVFVQIYMIHAETQELLWYGQVQSPDNFKRDNLLEELIQRVVAQIPSAFIAD